MSHLDEGTLHALLDGEIASAELVAVERHLADCPACRAKLEEARAFRDEAFGMIDALTPVSAGVLASPATSLPAPAAAASPVRRTAAGQVPPASSKIVRWARPVAWAATTVLAVGIGYTIAQRGDVAAPTTLQSAPAEIAAAPTDADTYRRDAADSGGPAVAAPLAAGPESRQAKPAASPEPAREPEASQQAPPPPPATAMAAAPAPPPKAADARAKDEGANTLADRVDAAGKRLAAPASRERDSTASRLLARRQALDTMPLRLEEIVVTRPTVGNAAAASGQVSADSAIRRLGGTIRLVEGLTPLRYELVDSVVRVAYQTSFGVLYLDQWREDQVLRHRLVAPRGVPADSLAAWEERIR